MNKELKIIDGVAYVVSDNEEVKIMEVTDNLEEILELENRCERIQGQISKIYRDENECSDALKCDSDIMKTGLLALLIGSPLIFCGIKLFLAGKFMFILLAYIASFSTTLMALSLIDARYYLKKRKNSEKILSELYNSLDTEKEKLDSLISKNKTSSESEVKNYSRVYDNHLIDEEINTLVNNTLEKSDESIKVKKIGCR